jgi:hypothetical protein
VRRCRHESEQLEQALTHGRALALGQCGEQVEQAPERIVHVSPGEVQVGDGELRIWIERRGCRGIPCRLQVETLHPVEQTHLAETRAGVVVAGVLGKRGLIGRDRAGVVALFDRVVRGLVMRRQWRSESSDASASWPSTGTEPVPLLRRQLQELSEDAPAAPARLP